MFPLLGRVFGFVQSDVDEKSGDNEGVPQRGGEGAVLHSGLPPQLGGQGRVLSLPQTPQRLPDPPQTSQVLLHVFSTPLEMPPNILKDCRIANVTWGSSR